MPLTDFFGTTAGFTQRPAVFVPFGGERLGLRYLTVADVWRLWSLFQADSERIFAGFTGKDAAAMHGFGTFVTDAVRLVYPDLAERRYADASASEYSAIFQWHAEHQRWSDIFEDLLHVKVGDTPTKPATDDEVIDYYRLMEQHTGRKIEELVNMRAEAFISLEDSVLRGLESDRKAKFEAKQTSDGFVPCSVYDLPKMLIAAGVCSVEEASH